MPRTAQNEKLLQLFAPHRHFAEVFFDGYVLVNADTKILACNKYFSRLTGVPANLLMMASSIEDIMRLEVNNAIVPFGELISHSKPTRIDEVKGITGKMEDHWLTLSIYPFWENEIFIGSFVMIRDVSADNELQSRYKVKSVLSITDPLTGLYNRAHLLQYLPAQFAKFRDIPGHVDERKMSLVIIDIDHFKKTNDTYGHLAGDYVIKEVARTLKANCRTSDMVYRYGGEEFLAILPETNLAGACAAAEKLRAAVEATKYTFEGTVIPTTISLGVAGINFTKEKMEEVMERADQALYDSKRAGRNRVTAREDSLAKDQDLDSRHNRTA